MSLNRIKLYIGHYSSYLLVPLFFLLCFIKKSYNALFDAIEETTDMVEDSQDEFKFRKMLSENA